MKKINLLLIIMLLTLSGCKRETVQDPVTGSAGSERTETAAAETQTETQTEVSDTAIVPQKAEASDDGVIEIKEKLFIAQTNDIYINTEDYLGKTIRLEGMFMEYFFPDNNTTYYYVIRYGPGCCTFDSNAGFEVYWDEDLPYPEDDDWVEAEGVLEMYEEDGYEYLTLRLTSLTVLENRGEEYVYS